MKTKIICTIGPASGNDDMLKKLMAAGMNVARINCSHGSIEANQTNIRMVQRVRSEVGAPLAVMLDTKGPDVRIGTFAEGSTIVADGQLFTITTKPVIGDNTRVSVDYKKFPQFLNTGNLLLLNDGMVKMTVVDTNETDVIARVTVGGKLSDRKSIFPPDVNLGMPFVSKADELDIVMGIQNDVDYIAASFVSCAQDVLDIKKILTKHNADIPIISKIESRKGVANIDEILRVSDGIMTARGDLGVEYPIEQIPTVQKLLTNKATTYGKIVITATEMLESMIEKPRPTRAETTDIANAVYDGTSAVMLSGETAVGKFPVGAVTFMRKIASEAEQHIAYDDQYFEKKTQVPDEKHAFANTITGASISARARAIIVFTESGGTAVRVAKYHPVCNVYAFARHEKVYHQLAMVNGIVPIYYPKSSNTADMLKVSNDFALTQKIANRGDIIIVNASYHDTDTDLVLIHPLN
jgi:pyruvate kinase